MFLKKRKKKLNICLKYIKKLNLNISILNIKNKNLGFHLTKKSKIKKKFKPSQDQPLDLSFTSNGAVQGFFIHRDLRHSSLADKRIGESLRKTKMAAATEAKTGSTNPVSL